LRNRQRDWAEGPLCYWKAVLNKPIPQLVAHSQANEGRPMTLPQIVEYVPELTPDLLARINTDLAAVVKR
jgi:hypothetical protein